MPGFTTNQWRPDVCGCVTNYFFPRDNPSDIHYLSPADHVKLMPEVFEGNGERVVNKVTGRVIDETVCPDHQGLSGQVLHETLMKESASKEIAFAHYVDVLGLCPSCHAPVVKGLCRGCNETPQDCGQLRQCASRRSLIFQWEFGKDRVLTVRFKNATSAHLSKIKAKVDESLGHDRTVVKLL